eukprot:269300-Pelagomonas_calceolata.AAC.17
MLRGCSKKRSQCSALPAGVQTCSLMYATFGKPLRDVHTHALLRHEDLREQPQGVLLKRATSQNEVQCMSHVQAQSVDVVAQSPRGTYKSEDQHLLV